MILLGAKKKPEKLTVKVSTSLTQTDADLAEAAAAAAGQTRAAWIRTQLRRSLQRQGV